MAFESNTNYDYTNQNYGEYGAEDNSQYQTFNGWELIIMVFSVIILVVALIYGVIAKGPSNRDSQRIFDMNQVSLALDSFYTNSNLIPSQRYYPISACDGSANTVDYEYTLREYLTGKKVEKETRVFVKPSDWKFDQWGTYSNSLGDRKIVQKCQPLLRLDPNNKTAPIYSDGTQSCNYSSSQNNSAFYKCYLYGSSVNGDKYTLGYYSEEKGQMVISTKFRSDKTKVVTCVPQKC
jgi:hypothetical protein